MFITTHSQLYVISNTALQISTKPGVVVLMLTASVALTASQPVPKRIITKQLPNRRTWMAIVPCVTEIALLYIRGGCSLIGTRARADGTLSGSSKAPDVISRR
jgi:hypothetical protein